MKAFVILTVFLVLSTQPAICSDKLKLTSLLDNIDKLYRSNSSFCEMEMKVVTPHWERTLELKAWSKGVDHTFIYIVSPKKDAGIATLRIENAMWNFFPKINKVIKVPPSMMMGSWMGSDFTNDDLVKETTLLDDYKGQFTKVNDQVYYYIDLIPKKSTVSVWGKIEIKIRKSDEMVVEQVYYDENGEKIRVMQLTDVKTLGGKKIPTKLILTPLNEKNQRTEVIYKDAKFNHKIDNSIFTRRNLQKRR